MYTPRVNKVHTDRCAAYGSLEVHTPRVNKVHVIDADVVDDDDLFRVMTINTTVTMMIMMMMALVSVAI